MDRIWDDVTLRKMYVTGSIGPSGHNEGFTVPYDLPNETAYAETCAAIGMVLWSHRMFLLHGHSQYIDVLERSLYNGLLSGVSLDGSEFFYTNPLASYGNHHRQPWFGCACCPTNVVRFVPQVGGYFYATTEDSLWVNLYAANRATVSVAGQTVSICQESDFPWDGHIKLTIEPTTSNNFRLCLRHPDWSSQVDLLVNGDRLRDLPANKNGYFELARIWQPGDTVEVNFNMSAQRIVTNPQVKSNLGKVALCRGPMIYCLEAIDNEGSTRDIALPRTNQLEASFESDLLGGVTVLRGAANRRGSTEWENQLYQTTEADRDIQIMAIPYFAWDSRQAGQMTVWLPECSTLTEPKLKASLASRGKPEASHLFGFLEAVNDCILPASSSDQSIPKFTWWHKKGSREWISLTFDNSVVISEADVYWFDDTGIGECRSPDQWWIEWDNEGEWQSVQNASEYGLRLDIFNHVTFNSVTTHRVRIVAQLQDNMSSGLLEWRLN